MDIVLINIFRVGSIVITGNGDSGVSAVINTPQSMLNGGFIPIQQFEERTHPMLKRIRLFIYVSTDMSSISSIMRFDLSPRCVIFT